MYRRRFRRTFNPKPYWIEARRPGKCGCGRTVAPGDRCLYFAKNRVIECESCGNRTQALLDYEDGVCRA